MPMLNNMAGALFPCAEFCSSNGAMTTALPFSTFGVFRIRLGVRHLPGLSGGKTSALLIYLAMEAGHKYRREKLPELFWPDLQVGPARFNLRHTFFTCAMRWLATRAPPFLLSGRDWLCFNPDSTFRMDAVEFAATVPACAAILSPEYCNPCIAKMAINLKNAGSA